MAVSDRERRELLEALVGTIGPEPTDTRLGYLPPVGWADVATKHDLDHFSTELRLEMSAMKSDLRAEIAGLRADLTTEIAGLRTELHVALNTQLRWMVSLIVLVILTVIGTGILTR